MDEKTFKARTKKLAVNIINQVDKLPDTRSVNAIANQLVRSGTSIGANYRAACRAKSTPDMINKLKIVEEESDETMYWLEILVEAGLIPREQIKDIYNETNEILAMTIASIKTLRNRKNQSSISNRKS
ncbi:MAG: four helix bundle protein [Anaerolineales bacterium]|nr:four helix bundle protein [Anaerolineales bacterium]MCB9113301.1 four helix bundle protein [Anaerolineales bacterium]